MASKTCPIHFIDYPEQLDECPYCVEVRREEAAKPRPPETPTTGEDRSALLAGIEALNETPPVASSATQPVVTPTFVTPTDGLRLDGPRTGEPPVDRPPTEEQTTRASAADPEPGVAAPTDAPVVDAAEALLALSRPTPRRTARGVAGTPEHDQPISEALLDSWKTTNQNVVVLLGFASAGKSWFLTRLKHKLFHDPSFPLRSEPAFADQGARVSRSNNISSHSFLPVAGAEGAHADDVFHIIDMPGERFEGVAGIDLFGRREELLALQVCKSVIIVLPADEVLLAERAAERYALWEDETAPTRTRVPKAQQTLESQARELAKSNPQLERFIKTLGRLQDLLSLLETGVDVDEIIAMGRDGVIAHAATAKRPSKPVFIGLAKADVIKDYIREIQDAYADGVPDKPVNLLHLLFKDVEADLLALERFDDDPLTTVRRFRRGLVQCMEGFRWCKLDFVTAFAEDEDPARRKRDPLRVDYSRRSWGVVPVIRWIQWAGRGRQISSPSDWAFISAARAIRRFRDDGRLTPLKRRSL